MNPSENHDLDGARRSGELSALPGDPILTTEEAAAYWRVSIATIKRRAGKGLVGTKIDGEWRFRRSELDAALRSEEQRVLVAPPGSRSDTLGQHASECGTIMA